MHRHGFTLIELLVVIAIIAVLAVVVVLTLNPAGLLQEARDSNRLSDMATLNSAIGLSLADNASESLGSPNVLYASVPDPLATSTLGDQCQGLGLPALPASFSWHCASSSTYRKVDGTGWVPVNLSQNTFGSSLSQLPTDPINTTSSRLFYAYVTDGQRYEAATPFESAKYKLGGSGDQIAGDGGTLATVYERGSKLGLIPLDYGDPSLVGYWTFDEGAGSVAYDYSGGNASGSWQGTGTHWAPGRVGSFAGQFSSTTIDYVNVPANSLQDISDTFSISAWLNISSIDPTVVRFISKAADANNFYMAGFSGSSFWAWFRKSGTDYRSFTNASIGTGNWAHFVAVFNRGALTLYINGLVDTLSGGGPGSAPAATFLSIGAFQGGIPSLTGKMDDVRIYNRALSATEIQAMYNGGK